MTPQQTIAHYRITAKIGEGGMGEVYRATDTKLGRDVAIKVLPDLFARDPDRMTRFTREAQVLATLNHPNIAQVYGVEERALVMELVEGPTLADRIAHGPMPLEEALPIATQIADALEYAHDHGVVHRDLKPANIKVTPEGRVKVLDFGLAKALLPDTVAANPVSSPTITMRATAAGTLIGTAAYMSPEQARGQYIDRRTDIWSFGVVVYEMLSGKHLFAGPTISDTLAAVLKSDPDMAAVPAQARPVIERCLRRDAQQRWRCIGDARMALEEPPSMPQRVVGNASRTWMAIAAVFAIVAAAGCYIAWRATRPVEHPLIRLSVDLGPDALTAPNVTAAISPDGRRLVFPVRKPDGTHQLATRLLEESQPTLLPGTEDGADPFFSPDGQWLGFFADGRMKKISFTGGGPVTLCPVVNERGAAWGQDGNIILAENLSTGLSRVSADGGSVQALTKLSPPEATHRWPQILPGGAAAIFTASPTTIGHENAAIMAVSLKTGQVTLVQRGGYFGRYIPTGHLLYVHEGAVLVKFDAARLQVSGAPTPVLDDIAGNPITGGGQFDSSGSAGGTLLYLAGKNAPQNWYVDVLDSSGTIQRLIRTPAIYVLPRFSPTVGSSCLSAAAVIFLFTILIARHSRVCRSGICHAPPYGRLMANTWHWGPVSESYGFVAMARVSRSRS